jgi:hypothetical protein
VALSVRLRRPARPRRSATRDAPRAGLSRTALAERSGLARQTLIRAVELLVACEAATERRGRYKPADLSRERFEAAVARDERRRLHDRTRLEMVRAYARTEGCRRAFILRYFGEYDAPDRCDMCDRCVIPCGQTPRERPDAAGVPIHRSTPAMPCGTRAGATAPSSR